MDEKQWILVIAGCAAVAFLVWFFKKLKAAQDEIKATIEERFSGQKIHMHDRLALHVAQQSSGYSQKRGNGNLILTDHELFFAMPCPKTIHTIPLKSILRIERPTRMGGKCMMKPLLKVCFKTETGEEDAIGFHVKELDRWESEIRSRSGLPTF